MDMAPPNAIPDDLLIDASDEIRIRQDLVLTALGHRPADRALRVGRLLDVHSRTVSLSTGSLRMAPINWR